MRKKIYDIIEPVKQDNLSSKIYDIFMMTVVIVSLVPLAFKAEPPLFYITDRITVLIFIVDYILRWSTADYKFGSKNISSFLRYPFTFMAVVDLVSILPSLKFLDSSFKLLRAFRMLRAMKVFRVLKTIRYSKNYRIINNVINRSKDSLLTVCMLAIVYILISALIVFNVEPDTFDSFFDAVYWATVSLTTIGYGDIFPVTVPGRIITMISSFFGIAIVALPAGIITAGYMQELSENGEDVTRTKETSETDQKEK